ncbi:ATP-binding cassette domain-containing protein, partial [Oscillospiraceae bacterium OttesenSCG-928-F05]|nr:ATP-binding cassette domain-containing protein [Oscillospiraceae bacterium OttesenSCG-928-F05]
TDMVNGFKELILNRKRRQAFQEDINSYSRKSADFRKVASVKALNFNIYNILMYNIVFGIVVFLFPIFVLGFDVNQLRENLFIVFYMIGPFGQIAYAIPRLAQVNVNKKRIQELIRSLGTRGAAPAAELAPPHAEQQIVIRFDQVCYQYKGEDNGDIDFQLGPISGDFYSGEIIFVVGGNGSGKSTFGKLLTGLYEPTEGQITVNNQSSTSLQNDLFSAIYGDYTILKKLYGVDLQEKEEAMKKLMRTMKIDDKVSVDSDGSFSSLNLSSGQKKRLAFVVSCLEDKPMVLFDEWAAEQDPEFRKFFYEELIAQLKDQGKGVVVITHDDRYFKHADRIIKFERGQLTTEL